jgi:exonuclease SbcC
LTLNNFKTYADQSFTFHPGINLFVGSSNNGKSQVFRAFYWLINNRPMGSSVVSYWNRDSKGVAIEQTKAVLKVDDKEVTRLRESGKNCYLFDNMSFEALKGNVPDEIVSFLNMSDINIQKQKEQPFLISFTPGEAAKYLNSIIKLDVIDDCLTYVKQKKSKCESALKVEIAELESLEKELNALDWVEDADSLLMKIELIEQERVSKEVVLSSLTELIVRYEKSQKKLSGFVKIEAVEKIVSEIRVIEKEVIEKRKQCDCLSALIEEYSEIKKKLNKNVSFQEAESIISEILEIECERKEKKKVFDVLKLQIDYYQGKKGKLVLIEKELVALDGELPSVCPLCGGKLKKE